MSISPTVILYKRIKIVIINFLSHKVGFYDGLCLIQMEESLAVAVLPHSPHT